MKARIVLLSLGAFLLSFSLVASFPQMARADITSGLAGYWNFDEGSGTTAADSSGNGKTASIVSGASWTGGKIGSGALSFSGSGNQVTVSSIGNLPETTVSMWVNFSDITSVHRFFDRVGEAPILRLVDGSLQFVGSSFVNGGSVQANQWYHVALVGGAAGQILYLNGAVSGSSATPYSVSSSGPLSIGGSLDYIVGSIDDVRIYSRALSASDISELYAYTGGSPAPADTTAPSVPSNLSATAVSQSSINLTWTASTDAVGVTGYKIYRGGTQIGTSVSTSYSDSGLAASTLYSYTVSAYDAANNTSSQSSSASATTQAVSVDTTPPVISAMSGGNPSSTGTTVTWTTNELSDTQVEYGLTTSYGSLTTLNTSLVTSHSQSITGLTSNTLYHYRVKSKDSAGNLSTSGDSTFTTAAVSVVTGNIYIAQSSAGSADGSSCSSPQSVTWFNTGSNWAASGTGKITPGTVVHLCGTISTTLGVYGSGTSGNPITILFEPGSKLSRDYWPSSSPAINSSGRSYITVDGNNVGIIENTANGTNLANQQITWGIGFENGSNITIKRLTIQNLYIRDIDSTDPTGGAGVGIRAINTSNVSNLVIDSTTITYSKYAIVADMSGANNVTISNNNISRCSTMVAIAKGDTAPTSGVAVYGNTFANGNYWDFDGTQDLFHGDGLHMWTSTGAFTDVSIYRNNMLTDWGRHTTGAIFLEGNYGTLNIHNNLVGTLAEKLEGIVNLSGRNNTTLNMYNNTVAGTATANYGGQALYLQGSTWASVNVKNNIFYNFYAAVSLSNTQSVSVLDFDNNDYYQLGNIAARYNPVNTDQMGAYGTLAAWSAYLGGDEASGKTVNPMFVSGSNWSLQASSPLINAGASLSGTYATDLLGTSRPQGAGWDIGAYEYGSGGGSPATYTLTVSKSGTGSGSVTGGSISCGSTCTQSSISSGTGVTLTATAGTGSTFTGWSGGGCSGTGTCAVTVSSDTTVIAAFNTSGSPATTYFIRDGGTSSSCTDWANACDTFPATLQRGATYYVADGSYPSYTFDDAVSGTSLITIKKAVAGDHGTDTGWSSVYGDGTASFAPITFNTSYYTFDGVTGGGTGSWTSGHGFVFTSTAGTSASYVVMADGVSSITVRHTSFTQTGNVNAFPAGATALYDAGYLNNSTFEYNHFDNLGALPFLFRFGSGNVIQYNWSGHICGQSVADVNQHCEAIVIHGMGNLQFRFNYIQESPSSGGFVKNNTQTSDSINIYGNVFRNGFPINCNSGPCTNWRIFNNTFASNLIGGPVGGDGTQTGLLLYNNITYGISSTQKMPGTHNYNWYSSVAGNSCQMSAAANENVNTLYPSTCDTITTSSNPFINVGGTIPEDLKLSAAIASNSGTNVCLLSGVTCDSTNQFDRDAFGSTRGSDGTWDRGAYEFAGGGTPPPTDTTLPTVSITAPINGSTVSGSSVSIAATASDNIGVVGVQWKLDGVDLGAELTISPYSGTWNTTSVSNGSHTLTATARDAAGNTRTSTVTITVSNSVADTTPPSTPTGITSSSLTQTGVTLSWLASIDNVGVSGYKLYRGTTLIASPTTNSYAVTGLTANTLYTFTVSAYDAAGNESSLSLPTSITTASVPVTTYTVTATKTGTGTGTITGNGLNCGSTCSVSVTSGTTITLTATPSADSTFTGWSGACTGTGSCTTTVTGVKAVSATFTLIPVSTPVTPPTGGGGGGGSTSSGGGAPSTGTLTPTVPQPAPTKPVVSCTTSTVVTAQSPFTRSLTVGSTGPDVKALQQFLNIRGFYVSLTGTGSKGNESTYFGPATAKAVAKFQLANGILPSSGLFGPITMKKVNSMLGTSSTIPCTPTVVPTTSSTYTRSLTIGSTGNDVKTLQIFLNTHGFPVATTGTGSRGNESTYFGPATTAALAKFQASKGIVPAAGYFGPMTMKTVMATK